MTKNNYMLDMIALLVDELGTEVELRDGSELIFLANTPTVAALERGADLLRRNNRKVPAVVGSVLKKVYPLGVAN